MPHAPNNTLASWRRQFYGDLLGWKVDADNPQHYGMVDTGAFRPIARLGYMDYGVLEPQDVFTLNRPLIDRYAPGESAGYPTLCKGRFDVEDDHSYYAIEEPTSLNTLSLLPQLAQMGVRAIKIEGRQRSPAYVAQVTKVWREAIDSCVAQPQHYTPKGQWMAALDQVAEGQQHTLGAYHRPWK